MTVLKKATIKSYDAASHKADVQLAAAQAIKDSGGTARLTPATASPHVTLTGGTRIEGQVGIFADPDPEDGLLAAWTPGTVGDANQRNLIRAQPSSNPTLDFANAALAGIAGAPTAVIGSGKTGIAVDALQFIIGISGGGAGTIVNRLACVNVQPLVAVYTGTVTELTGLLAKTPLLLAGAPSVTTAYGAWIQNWGNSNKVVDAYGLRIDDMTANTGFRRIIEAGGTIGSLPNLRVEANAPTGGGANAGISRLFATFNEGQGVNALRRVEWKTQSTLVAGDRVLVAV